MWREVLNFKDQSMIDSVKIIPNKASLYIEYISQTCLKYNTI